MQQTYLTPIKTMIKLKEKSCKTDLSKHQGDWVCLNCQNLNFSFRKKCNRCKTQSRQENDTKTIYSQYYYNQYQSQNILNQQIGSNQNQQLIDKQTQMHINSPNIQEFNPIQNYQNYSPQVMQTPKKKKTPGYTSSQNPKKKDNLPSVTPLVKKYLQHHTTIQRFNQKSIKFEHKKKQSFQDYEHIQIRDFDQLLFGMEVTNKQNMDFHKDNIYMQDNSNQKYNYQQFNDQMQKIQESIAKIIL